MDKLSELQTLIDGMGPAKQPQVSLPPQARERVKLPPMGTPLSKLSRELPGLPGRIEYGPALPTQRAPIGWKGIRTHWIYARECDKTNCGAPLEQELLSRTDEGGEHWEVKPCAKCNPIVLGTALPGRPG